VIGPRFGNGMILSEGEKCAQPAPPVCAPFAAGATCLYWTPSLCQDGDELAAFLPSAGDVDVSDAAQEATLTNLARDVFGQRSRVETGCPPGCDASPTTSSYMSLLI